MKLRVKKAPATPRKSNTRAAKSHRAHEELSPQMLSRVARRFEALSDPTRLRVLQAVCRGVRSVSEIARATKLALPNTSRHLARLRHEAFVIREAVGRTAEYRVADETPQSLCAAICAHLDAADARLVGR